MADRDDILILLGNSANVPSDDVLRGLETISKDTTVKETYRFCFFLDALDELEDTLEHDYRFLVVILLPWTRMSPGSFKLCVSS